MADITKRTQKRGADHLDGEQVEAALLCEPKGTYGLGMVPGVLMPRTTIDVLAGRAVDSNDAEGGIAAHFPGESCVLAVTPTRVVVMPSNGLRFDPPALVLERRDVRVGEVTRKGLGKRVRLVFADGTAVDVDAQRGQPFAELVHLLGLAPVS